MHFYYRDVDGTLPILGHRLRSGLPFFGYAESLADNSTAGTPAGTTGDGVRESYFVLDAHTGFAERYDAYMAAVGFDADVAARFRHIILHKHPGVSEICIHRKLAGQIFVQWLGITKTQFLAVLEEVAAPAALVEHVRAGDYHIVHEVTVVYRTSDRSVVRGSFYGVL